MKALKVDGGCVDVGKMYWNVSHGLVKILVDSLPVFLKFGPLYNYGDVQEVYR